MYVKLNSLARGKELGVPVAKIGSFNSRIIQCAAPSSKRLQSTPFVIKEPKIAGNEIFEISQLIFSCFAKYTFVSHLRPVFKCKIVARKSVKNLRSLVISLPSKHTKCQNLRPTTKCLVIKQTLFTRNVLIPTTAKNQQIALE